jgi:hypothetical protein
VAVTTAAVTLVLAAEIAATLSATAAHAPKPRHAATVRAHASPLRYTGEPYLPPRSTAPGAARIAAVRFVRDYALWNSGRLGAIPAQDATRRVIRLLEQAGKIDRGASTDAVASVRVASAGEHGRVVTSAIGNFLIGRRGQRWLVVSLPGD